MNGMTDLSARARSFLSGEALTLSEARALWKQLQDCSQTSSARAVLAHIRDDGSLLDPSSLSPKIRRELIQQEAMLTSKDPELSSATRHDQATALLSKEFDLNAPSFIDAETLGIAGGIYKRRWFELGSSRIYDVRWRSTSAVRKVRKARQTWATMLTPISTLRFPCLKCY